MVEIGGFEHLEVMREKVEDVLNLGGEMVEIGGFEPPTSAMRRQRSPN
jgi:hypothetical protein